MKVIIQKAKNGEETVSIDGHFLHSNYAPEKEAERFVENLTLPYTPKSIIISEPGLSYAAEYLKARFPDIKIGVIRYTDSFEEYNSKFDFVLNYYEHINFETYLYSTFTEEEVLTTWFISWPASAQIFSDTEKKVWSAIKSVMERSKTLLITRQYFEKKWFLNSCTFLRYLKNVCSINSKIDRDVLIISSGPSLIPFINTIKENQKNFFIICLSSAISLCLKNQIIPDLCMTTDGGYWAGEHLKKLYKYSIPLAMPAEAHCPKALLSKLKILPLDYGDGISHQLLDMTKLETKKAFRNGTVSGTALLFALSNSTKNIYLCGLDLANQKGFQHTQPNELEINSSFFDNRIKTKSLRLSRSELTVGSLDIYKDWFINNPQKNENRNVVRLMEDKNKKNDLGWIKDINLETFISKISDKTEDKDFSFSNRNIEYNKESVINLLNNDIYTEKWQRQLFPLDYILLSHNPLNKEVESKIENEWNKLKKQAERIFL